MPGRDQRRVSALTLPKNIQATAIPAMWSWAREPFINLRYVAALSIGSELSGDGSVIDARNRVTFAWWTQ